MDELAYLLRNSGEGEWCTWVRQCELQLIASINKKQKKFPDGAPISSPGINNAGAIHAYVGQPVRAGLSPTKRNAAGDPVWF